MDKSISDAQRLCALDKQQARIVYLIRHKYSNKDIGGALDLDAKTISDYMAPIYDTLDIHLDNPGAKRNEISNRYKELIDQYIPDDSALEYWVRIPLPSELEEEDIDQSVVREETTTDIGEPATDIGKTQSEFNGEEIEQPEITEGKTSEIPEIKTIPEETPSSANGSETILKEVEEISKRQGMGEPPPPRRIPRWIFIAIPLVLCLACASAAILGFGFIRPLIGTLIDQFQATQIPANIPEPSITQDLPLSPTTPPAVAVTESPTELPEVVPTDTLAPTETSSPTHTPEPPPTSTSTITPIPPLFEDTFEAGLSEGWIPVYGDVGIVDGNLVARESTMMMVGSEDWSNYHIQTEVSSPDCWFAYGISAIGVLALDRDNMIAYGWSDCQRVIYEVTNGEWVSVPGTGKQRSGGVGFETLDIYVEGSSITVYDNNQILVSYVADWDQGMVALRLDAETQVKYFRVEQIP